MPGRSDRLFLDARRRSRRGPPRWLVLLVLGTVAGAAGVLVVQQRLLPPRLSPAESAALQSAFDRAESERAQLKDRLAQVNSSLQTTLAERAALATQLAASRGETERLRADLTAVVEQLPPDPRDGAVAVRAARFAARDGQVAYAVVLTRDAPGTKPFAGRLQLQLAGESSAGQAATHAPPPIALSFDAQSVLRGSLALPAGFRAREATVRVLDRAGDRALGLRVLRVK